MARIRMTWDERDIGNNEFYYGYIFRGALAWLEGLPIESDPYGFGAPAFSNAWRRGWEEAAKGRIKVKIFKRQSGKRKNRQKLDSVNKGER